MRRKAEPLPRTHTALNYLTAVKTRGSLTLYKKAIAFCEGMKSFLLPRATRGIRDGAKKRVRFMISARVRLPQRWTFSRTVSLLKTHWPNLISLVKSTLQDHWKFHRCGFRERLNQKVLNRIKLLMGWWPLFNKSTPILTQNYFLLHVIQRLLLEGE